jgi:hypothetical protein
MDMVLRKYIKALTTKAFKKLTKLCMLHLEKIDLQGEFADFCHLTLLTVLHTRARRNFMDQNVSQLTNLYTLFFSNSSLLPGNKVEPFGQIKRSIDGLNMRL